MRKLTGILAFCAVIGTPVALAHHNAASHYVMDQITTATGTVTQFKLVNPHVRVYFDVVDENGEVVPWLAEGNSSSILRRRGWTADSLKPGDVITVTGRPARDGSNKIDWESIEVSDGNVLRGGNTQGSEKTRQLDMIEQRRQQQREDSTNTDADGTEADKSEN